MRYLILLLLIIANSGCDSVFKIGGRYNNVRYDDKYTKEIAGKSKNRSKDFFFRGNNDYWENKYLSDFKFYLEETKHSVVAVGRKKRLHNHKYVSENQVYNIEKKCFLELPRTLQKQEDTQFDSHLLKPEENCFYHNLDEGKEKIIKGNGVILKSTDFAALDEWDYDNFSDGMESFLNSCSAFERYKKQNINIVGGGLIFGKIDDWLKVCKVALKYQEHGEYKAFFENHFQPFALYSSNKNKRGTFTGYYELTLNGSKQRTSKYRYPIYMKPPECAKKSTCYTREEISKGAISNRGLELYWVDDFIDLWRLQMQGSGIVDFEDGSYARVGFGGGNGYAYRRFLDYFKYHDLLPPGNHSATFIYQWMRDNPEYGIKAMNYNPSYLYFVKLPDNGRSSKGAQIVPLTPSRSVAVDTEFIPLGMPMWIETKISVKHELSNNWLDFNRLVVAQDVGSAIKGPARLDIFFGHGAKSRYLAETLRYDGQVYFLLPKRIAGKIKER